MQVLVSKLDSEMEVLWQKVKDVMVKDIAGTKKYIKYI